MTKEKKLIGFHMALLIICSVCRIYCQMNIQDWYYRYQYGELLMVDLLLTKPLFYYALGFLAVYLIARKAFRSDLQLPYKGLSITAGIFLAVYAIAALMIVIYSLLDMVVSGKVSYFATIVILDYYWLLCVPGIMLGLSAEKRYRNTFV